MFYLARYANFEPATLRFLEELAANNNREWFNENKARYEEQVLDVALRFCQARLSVPTAEQLMVVPLLENGRAYSEGLRGEYQARRDAVYEGLAAIDGVSPHRSEGSFYCMTRLPIDSAERFAAWRC